MNVSEGSKSGCSQSYFSFLYLRLYKSTRAKNPVTNPPRCPSHEIDFSPVISGLGKTYQTAMITITAKERATSLLYLVCMP
jgi:hypothetical protein